MTTINISEMTHEKISETAERMRTLTRDIGTLLERIQDLLEVDEDLIALFDISFVCAMRSAGSPDHTCIVGAPSEVLENLKGITNHLKSAQLHEVTIVQGPEDSPGREKSSESDKEK